MFETRKEKALKLRRKGFSYSEISRKLGIPKGSLSYMFRNEEWSNQISKRNSRDARIQNMSKINKSRSLRLKVKYAQAEEEAIREYNVYKNHALFIAALMIYSGEGDKTLRNNLVRVANSDFKTLKIFNLFLLKFCGSSQEQIKMSLVLYPDLKDRVCKKIWSREVGISQSNFYKTQFIQGKHSSRKLPYGVGNIILGNKYLKVKILKWIKLLSDNLVKSNADIV